MIAIGIWLLGIFVVLGIVVVLVCIGGIKKPSPKV